MGRFLLRRLLLAIPTLIGLTLLVFLLCALAPGAVGSADSSPGALPGSNDAADRALRARLGLDDPVLVQYGRWLAGVCPIKFGAADPDQVVPIIRGWIGVGPPDLGRTVVSGRPIGSALASALPVTLLMNALACLIVYAIGVPTGLLAAAVRGSRLDRLMNGAFPALWSIPTVWACVLALGYLAHRSGLGWFPIGGLHRSDAAEMTFLPVRDENGRWLPGYVVDALYHLCLPVLCLSYAGLAILSRQVRAAAAEQLSADYVRTARAKGLSRRRVLAAHVMRNCLLPLITMLSSMLPALLAGSVVVERVFAIPGMGTLVLQAVAERDRGLLLASVVLVGVVCIIANVLADVLYAAADPRIVPR